MVGVVVLLVLVLLLLQLLVFAAAAAAACAGAGAGAGCCSNNSCPWSGVRDEAVLIVVHIDHLRRYFLN